MGKHLNRKVLKVNNRTNVKSEFIYNPVQGYKSDAQPSIVTWRGNGKGTKGESTNTSGDVGSKFIINKLRKPL